MSTTSKERAGEKRKEGDMDDLNAHIFAMQNKLEAEDLMETPVFYMEYMRAQLLCARGMYREALHHLETGWVEAKPFCNDFVWESICVNLGSLLAITLDYLGETDRAQVIYEELLKLNPIGPFIGDYAVFLHRRKRDFNLAQSFYVKALQVYPTQSTIHLKYAGFLRHVKRDISSAEQHYKLAVEMNPGHADALGSYASFLHGVSGKVDLAEQYYEKAIKLDDTHANNLCNFGLFLSEEKKSYDRAESHYKRALCATPRHANTLYNFLLPTTPSS
jgi:Tfp pilus assembly protein PilF